MLTRMAQGLSSFFISRNIIKEEDKLVYDYSFEILLSTVINLLAVIVLAYICKVVVPTIFFLLGFIAIRTTAGGFHAETVMAFAAEILYLPQYSSTTGRYTQEYEMSVEYNWKYTANISNLHGYGNHNIDDYLLKKKYSNRDGLVQCTSNGLTAFPTYYKISNYNDGNISTLTAEVSLMGTGIQTIDLPNNCLDDDLCLGIRHDPRYSSSVTNKGSWSPDTY